MLLCSREDQLLAKARGQSLLSGLKSTISKYQKDIKDWATLPWYFRLAFKQKDQQHWEGTNFHDVLWVPGSTTKSWWVLALQVLCSTSGTYFCYWLLVIHLPASLNGHIFPRWSQTFLQSANALYHGAPGHIAQIAALCNLLLFMEFWPHVCLYKTQSPSCYYHGIPIPGARMPPFSVHYLQPERPRSCEDK